MFKCDVCSRHTVTRERNRLLDGYAAVPKGVSAHVGRRDGLADSAYLLRRTDCHHAGRDAGIAMTPTPRIPVCYSIHYDNDVFRVQQIRHMGAIEDNPPVAANEWEQLKRKGDAAAEEWIDDNMKWRRC